MGLLWPSVCVYPGALLVVSRRHPGAFCVIWPTRNMNGCCRCVPLIANRRALCRFWCCCQMEFMLCAFRLPSSKRPKPMQQSHFFSKCHYMIYGHGPGIASSCAIVHHAFISNRRADGHVFQLYGRPYEHEEKIQNF